MRATSASLHDRQNSVEQGGFAGPRRPGEFRRRCAGAHRRDGDTGTAQFVGDRLAETQNIGLARIVDSHSRPGHEGGRRGHQHHAAAPPRHHSRQDQAREFGERHDIDLQHRRDLRRIGLIEPSVVADARGVDQHVDREAARRDDLHQCRRAARYAEISGNDGDLRTRSVEFGRKGLHRFAAACHKHEIVSVVCGRARQFGADATRRAGDKGNGTGRIDHSSDAFFWSPTNPDPLLEPW